MTCEAAILKQERGAPPLERTLSVVISAYHDERRWPDTLKDRSAFLTAGGIRAGNIVVDDGSLDRTAQVTLAHRDSYSVFRALRHAPNTGQGWAVTRGIL